MTIEPSDSRSITRVPTPEIHDPVVTSTAPIDGVESSLPSKKPFRYAVLREGNTSPEPLNAMNDEDAFNRLKKEVTLGQCKVVYLFKLVGAEVYEPSSRSISLEEIFSA